MPLSSGCDGNVTPIEALAFDYSTIVLGANYLLLGSDAFLVDSIADGIRNALKSSSSADLVIIYGDEVKAAQLNDLLDTYSIFSSAKLILLRNAGALEQKELDCLAAYFGSPAETQSLIIAADKIDARISGWKKIKDHCQIVVCDPPRWGGNMSAWIERELKKMGKTMSSNAKELFASRIELDYANASNELQKLSLLSGDSRQISEADVIRSLGSSRVGTQIDFFRSLGRRQIKQCLELLDRMLSSDWEPLQILGMLSRFYSQIYRILLLKKNHISTAEIVSKHLQDLFPNQKQEYVNFSANYELAGMAKIYAILIETDYKLKSSSAAGSILLTMCVLKILDNK